MAKCLKCGAGDEWLQGNVASVPADEEVVSLRQAEKEEKRTHLTLRIQNAVAVMRDQQRLSLGDREALAQFLEELSDALDAAEKLASYQCAAQWRDKCKAAKAGAETPVEEKRDA